jgi:dienelactone hydrolase
MRSERPRTLLAACIAPVACSHVLALAQDLAAPPVTTLNEEIGYVSIEPGPGGGSRLQMQYTLYKPDGPGPFPLVVVNHGRARNPRAQPRDQPTVLAFQLVARGYAVVAPMRRGFAGTPGDYRGNHCVDSRRLDKRGWGNLQSWDFTEETFDLHAFINQIVGRRDVDRSRMLMVSQSGGLTSTLGYMTAPRSGLLGYVNFVGGGFISCDGSKGNESRAAGAELGPRVRREGLWIYARRDSFVTAASARVLYDAFVQSGGRAQWLELDPPIAEGHYMLGDFRAVPTWWPYVETFLQQLSLPTEVRFRVAHLGRATRPTRSGFARIGDVEAVPHLNASGREAYRRFLTQPAPRAFAVARNGAFATSAADLYASDRSLAECFKIAGRACALYAVDDDVVWHDAAQGGRARP